MFQKGHKKLENSGRRAGTPNKKTADIKALAFQSAPDAITELVRLLKHSQNEAVRVSAANTGRSTRPIGKAALHLLLTIPRRQSEFVFPNRDGSGRADLKKAIAALFDQAGLIDARSHDLRRTFASTAAELGYSDATIAELIGHARRGVTERHYVRRPDAVLIAAADRVAAQITAVMADNAGAEIFPINETGSGSGEVVPLTKTKPTG